MKMQKNLYYMHRCGDLLEKIRRLDKSERIKAICEGLEAMLNNNPGNKLFSINNVLCKIIDEIEGIES